ncbi:single-stranded-DNA-specific exonuclease [Xylanibacillus composti]|uniref:Single-stranded-DNA-specific exonuclease RecJ n=1 Tax=Xylanibacillus composti TaxID=1572762 RepID=A0A8J4M2V8_9BACL|nr:single-stranded-DNA-specific exonuclease RecJ [Xylanibacillus composti]GIQ70129.1 single-stranded-DNA-specific exonuclease [Xylanibacillus composti]
MLHAKARWNIQTTAQAEADRLAEEAGISRLLARCFLLRGIRTAAEVHAFLADSGDCYEDPFAMRDMQVAVERIRSAIARGERILVYGDYDADGVSSTSLMVYVLKELGADFDYYIPHRQTEGYGLNVHALDEAKEKRTDLLITVDNGISAVEPIAYANELGLDVIVTDHHEPPDQLPEALALLNPKRPDCPYPFKGLAGVGVALKLAQALTGETRPQWLQVAAIGTVADLMPLTGENRTIVKAGLAAMETDPLPGVRALAAVSGLSGKRLTSTHIGFSLGPRINAGGRLDSALPAVELLTTQSEQAAEQLAHDLDACNAERQQLVQEMLEEAKAIVESQGQTSEKRSIVVAKEGWNIGVAGIVSSKLTDCYYRPSVVLCIDRNTGKAKGSARSIDGFDLYAALTACSHLLEHYGGHQAAAGMTLQAEQVPAFAEALERLAAEQLREENLQPMLHADGECVLDDITLETAAELERLAPFGMSNPLPRFVLRQVAVEEMRQLGKDGSHLRLKLRSASARAEAIAFGAGESAWRISPTATLDVLAEITVNEWNGNRKPQLMVQDMLVPHVQIFDWRGDRCDSPRVSRLARELHTRTGIVLLGHANQEETVYWREQAEARGASAVWLTAGGQLAAASANPAELGSVHEQAWTDLVLVGLPNRLEDLQALLSRCEQVERMYALFGEPDHAAWHMPNREHFKQIYALLRGQSQWPLAAQKSWQATLARKCGISQEIVRFAIEVFEELGFIARIGSSSLQVVEKPAKKDLAESAAYRKRKALARTTERLVSSTSEQVSEWLLGSLGHAVGHSDEPYSNKPSVTEDAV